MSYDYLFKVIILGDERVGKSLLLLSFTSTPWGEFGAKIININGLSIRLNVFDTPKIEKFAPVTTGFYRATAAAIFVYDVSRRKSLDSVNYWINKAAQHAPRNIVRILVGNKVDKLGEREVSFEEAQNFANEHHMMYLETSAITGLNVDNAFNCVASEILMKIRNGTINPADGTLGIKASTAN